MKLVCGGGEVGLLHKPTGVLDVGGFWQPLLDLLEALAVHDVGHEPEWIGGGRQLNRP